jgi:hypothetical protein
MIRPDSMLESQNPTCDSYPVPLGDGLGQKYPLRRTPRLPISITDRSVMARSSERAESERAQPDCAVRTHLPPPACRKSCHKVNLATSPV